MPEYMDYNDTNDFKTAKQKRRSNILFVLSILFMVAVIVFVIVRNPENVRTDFDPVSSSWNTVGQGVEETENEFLAFRSDLQGKTMTLSDDFRSKYPHVYEILTADRSTLTQNTVQHFDDGRYLTLSIPYVATEDTNYEEQGSEYVSGLIGADFTVIEYVSDNGVSVSAPVRFSVRYHKTQSDSIPFVELYHVESTSFRLNFYTLTLDIQPAAATDTVDCAIDLSDPINKSEFDSDKWAKKINFDSIEADSVMRLGGGERGDTNAQYRYTFESPQKTLKLIMEFDDAMYQKFEKLTVQNLPDGTTFRITVN